MRLDHELFLTKTMLLSLIEKPERFRSAHTEGVTPEPIPNSEVKPLRADGTNSARDWESRTALRFFIWCLQASRKRASTNFTDVSYTLILTASPPFSPYLVIVDHGARQTRDFLSTMTAYSMLDAD